MKIKFVLGILIIGIICTQFTCHKTGLGCANTIYSFNINSLAYPDKDSIKVGDTIWISLNSPTMVKDSTSGAEIDYSNAKNIGTALSILLFTGGSIMDPGSVYAANNFDYYLIKGKSVPNLNIEGIREFSFNEINNQYVFLLGIIPKKPGVYGIGIHDAANVYRGNDPCTKASFNIIFFNTNQHLYFYQQNRPGYTISGYEQTHLYCFKVI